MAEDLKFKVGADTKPAKDKLKELEREAKKTEVIVGVEIDGSKVKKEIQEIGNEIEKTKPTVEVNIEADTGKAEKDIENLKRETEQNKIIKMSVEFGKLEEIEKVFDEIKKKANEIAIKPQEADKREIEAISKAIDDMVEKTKNIKFLGQETGKFKDEALAIKKELENIQVKLKFENSKKELDQQVEQIKKKVEDIKINPKNFGKEDIAAVKKELLEIAAKAEALHIGDPEKAKAISQEMENMAKGLTKSKDEANGLSNQFSLMKLTVAHLAADLVKSVFNGLKKATLEGSKLNRELGMGIEKIKTISKENTGSLNYEIMATAKNFGIDPREVSEGLYQIITSVGDVAGKFEFLETSAKLAKTGFLEINDAVDGLSTVLNAYNMSMDKAADVANVFVKTQKVGKTTVKEFANSLSKTVQVAKELNMSIEEIGASTALSTSKGATTSAAQTQLSQFLYEVQNTGSKINEVFQQAAGKSSQEFFNNGGKMHEYISMIKQYSEAMNIDVVSTLGNKNAKNFYLTMAGDMEGYNAKLKEISTNTGELDKNTQALMSTFDSRMKRAGEYANEFKSSLGEAYNTVVAKIGDFVTGHDEAAVAQQRMNNEVEKNIGTIAELTQKMGESKDMTKLNEGEQNNLNNALEMMRVLAPAIYDAFVNWTSGAEGYANVLGLVAARQREVLSMNAMLNLQENRKKLEEVKKDRDNSVRDLLLSSGHLPRVDEEDKKKVKQGILDTVVNGERYEYNMDNILKKNPELIKDIQNNTGLMEMYQEIIANEQKIKKYEDSIKPAEDEVKKSLADVASGGTITAMENSIKATENLVKTTKELAKNSSKENQRKEVQNEKELKLNYDTQITELKKGLEGAGTKAAAEINKKIRAIGLQKEIALEKNQLASLNNKYRNSEDKNTLKDYNLERNIIENRIKSLETDLALNEQGTGRSGGGGRKKRDTSDREAQKAYQESELAINNEYLEKKNQLTQEYYEKMSEALKAKNLKAVDELQKELQKTMNSLDSENKIKVLEHKAENAPNLSTAERQKTALEAQNLKLQASQKELDEKKLEEDKRLNENTKNLNLAMENLSLVMSSIANSQTGSKAGNAINQALGIGGSVLNGLSQVGALDGLLKGGGTLSNILGGASKLFGNATKGANVGNIISGIMGGGQEGNLGSTLGSLAGGLLGGGVGSVLGGALGSIAGSLFGSKKRKKEEKELKKYKKAQEALEKSQRTAADDWSIYAEQYAEQFERRGGADMMKLYDKVVNVRSLSQVQGALEGNQLKGSSKFSSGNSAYGVKMDTLRELLPQYNDKEIMDWFAGITGGAVQNGEFLESGQGKYGVFDLDKLADEIAKINKDFAAQLKQQIKEIINFTADNIASVVSQGFGEGLEDLGNNLEKQVAESLKSAFLNTQIFKDLSFGFSDLMSDYITDMFKNDPNLGVNMNTEGLSTPQQYIEALKQYAEYSTELQKEIFEKLGLNIDNLTGAVDSLNNNLSKNSVQGLATNLFKYNAGQDPGAEFKQDIVVNVMIDEDALKKKIMKVTTDSMSKVRRGGYS